MQYCPLMPGMSQSDGALAEGALADSALAGGQPVDGPLVAGLDIGTTAVKAVMVDDDGRIVSRSRVASRLAIGPDGSFEHDALASWWEAPRSALALALAGRRPRAVAVSAMMPSVAAVDTDGRPLGPGLLYGDRRPRSPRTALSGDPTASDEMALLCGWVAGRHRLLARPGRCQRFARGGWGHRSGVGVRGRPALRRLGLGRSRVRGCWFPVRPPAEGCRFRRSRGQFGARTARRARRR